ncbi:MAG: outer membrane lipoprotein-sorting protein [Balneolaceae bacterium]|nr:outer membrane lipoprotein-sorting protein [Balneolaceae bacterium]
MRIFILLSVIGLIAVLPNTGNAQSAVEIIERMEEVMRGESQYAEMTMKIVRPRYEREVSMRSWLLGRDHSLILITAPARDEGTAFLMRGNDIWNYDPRIDRTTRLPSSMMAQSWMGSDFTNDDLVRDSDLIDDFDHELLRTEEYNGYESYVIEMIPKPDTPIVWGKVKMWIAKDDYIQLRIENYDQRDQLVNTMELDEIEEIGNRKVPKRITVIPADKDNERTILTYQQIEFGIDVDEEFFSRANMQRLR